MDRIYYVTELFEGEMTSGNIVPEGTIYRTYDEALNAFNDLLLQHGRQLVKHSKTEKVLTVNIGARYIQLWFITVTADVALTENIE